MTTIRPKTPSSSSFSSGSQFDSLSWDGTKWRADTRSVKEMVSRPLDEREAIEIYFLSPVKVIQKDSILCTDISNEFCVPPFFWSKAGYEANGFFGAQHNPLRSVKQHSYSSHSRFLIKELIPNETDYDYDWQYLAFTTLWSVSAGDPNKSTQTLLCYDLSPKMKGLIIDGFKAIDPEACRYCPLGIYGVLMAVIVGYFDQALWGFREPVRDIEKSRISNVNASKVDRSTMVKRHLGMHELSRHVIHKKETLDVAVRTLKSLVDNHHDWCSAANSDPNGHCGHVKKELEFFESFLGNLRLRAKAFNERLENEITLAYNLFAADDNATAKEILKETRNDGRDLANLVSLLTLIFLPGSFFTGFFGMNFFQFNGQAVLTSADNLWLFFAVTGPITGTAVMLWLYYKWTSRQRRAQAKQANVLYKSTTNLTHRSTFPRLP